MTVWPSALDRPCQALSLARATRADSDHPGKRGQAHSGRPASVTVSEATRLRMRMHAPDSAPYAKPRRRRGPSVAVRETADGAHRPSWGTDAVRYTSVDTAT
jgi:hypothetical protein